jgi:hypothetical protein
MAPIDIACSAFHRPFPGLCNEAVRNARPGKLPFDKGLDDEDLESIMALV